MDYLVWGKFEIVDQLHENDSNSGISIFLLQIWLFNMGVAQWIERLHISNSVCYCLQVTWHTAFGFSYICCKYASGLCDFCKYMV